MQLIQAVTLLVKAKVAARKHREPIQHCWELFPTPLFLLLIYIIAEEQSVKSKSINCSEAVCGQQQLFVMLQRRGTQQPRTSCWRDAGAVQCWRCAVLGV